MFLASDAASYINGVELFYLASHPATEATRWIPLLDGLVMELGLSLDCPVGLDPRQTGVAAADADLTDALIIS